MLSNHAVSLVELFMPCDPHVLGEELPVCRAMSNGRERSKGRLPALSLENCLCLCIQAAFSVEHLCFCPDFTVPKISRVRLEKHSRVDGNRSPKLHLHGHGGDELRIPQKDCICHGLVEQCCNKASMKVADVSLTASADAHNPQQLGVRQEHANGSGLRKDKIGSATRMQGTFFDVDSLCLRLLEKLVHPCFVFLRICFAIVF
mmetsp:Transcript_9731/g.29569  ORF Transcript_9731/g.29569 Transcript_9731/m.29569 type:complete len:203 (-) Transcript_9731:197-805(-)